MRGFVCEWYGWACTHALWSLCLVEVRVGSVIEFWAAWTGLIFPKHAPCLRHPTREITFVNKTIRINQCSDFDCIDLSKLIYSKT